MQITLTPHKAYGKLRYYPSCTVTAWVLKVAGRKCFTEAEIKLARDMGIEIVETADAMD